MNLTITQLRLIDGRGMQVLKNFDFVVADEKTKITMLANGSYHVHRKDMPEGKQHIVIPAALVHFALAEEAKAEAKPKTA